MSILIGYDYWGNVFQDNSPSIRDVKFAEFGNSVIDEISLKQKTNEKANVGLKYIDDFSGTVENLEIIE
ncbi:MAG: hypothetical protein K0S80_2923 [Neobacillus sp.]|nr:hypothetical protein [Neobacillus sp.]